MCGIRNLDEAHGIIHILYTGQPWAFDALKVQKSAMCGIRV